MSEDEAALPTEDSPLKTIGQTLWIDGDSLVIKYSALYYGFLGQKRVPAQNIKTASWRDPGAIMAGFLEISILGEPPVHSFASPNVQNQNRFQYKAQDIARWQALKGWIDEQMSQREGGSNSSAADEIRKLVELLKDGHLTQEEFDSQKAKLLR